MTRILALSLAILLAVPPVAFPAPKPSPNATALSVAHAAVQCVIAGTNPQIDAGIAPEAQSARAYFRSALGEAFYYVEMTAVAGRYVGVLPKPEVGAGSVTYYVEGVGSDCRIGQTPQTNAIVVSVADACQGKDMASVGPPDPVRVFSVGGGTELPPGFSGVSSVVAAAAGPCAAVPPANGTNGGAVPVAAAAAAGGSFFTSQTGIIVMGGLAAGVGAVVIVNDDNPPASPIR
jgi:hypothetical protein